ncbi:MAG: hypothetical protein V4498_00005 [candidate division FCPU426 bacterium]
MTDKVFAKGLTGKSYEVQPHQLESALEGGAKPISEAEALSNEKAYAKMREVDANWSGPEKAAAGVFSGLTLGLGPAALAATGAADRDTLDELGASGAYQVGDVAGMLAPAILSGGEAVAARGAVGAGEGLLGRALGWAPAGLMARSGGVAEALAGRLLPEAGVLGKVGRSAVQMGARGATEGSIIGLAHATSESYIQDKPLTAQSLAASGVNGALFGGLAGGILGGAAGLAGAVGDVATGSVGSALGGKGEAAAAKALLRGGATEADIGRWAVQEGGLTKVVRDFHDNLGGETFASSTGNIAKALKGSEEGWTKGANDIVTQLDAEAASKVPDVTRTLARAQGDLDTKYAGMLDQNPVSKAMSGLSEDLTGALGGGSPKPSFAGEAPVFKDPFQFAAETEKFNAAKALHAELPEVLPGQTATWKQWVTSRDQLAARLEKARGGPQEEVYRTVLGAMDSEIASAMDSAGIAMGKESIGEQFRAAVMGQKMTEEFGSMAQSKLGRELAGGDKGALSQADVNQMGWSTLMGHPVVGVGITAAKGVHRMLRDKVEPFMAEAAYRNAVGAQAAKATVDVGNRVQSTLKKFMGMGGKVTAMEGVKADKPKYTMKGYKDAMELSDKLTSQVHKAKVDDLAAAIAQMGHQDLANEMQAQYMRATAYLAYNRPADAKIKAASSLGRTPVRMGLDSKEMRYMNILSAVSSPMSIVDGILDGSTSRAQVNAIAYIMPEWHADIVSRAASMCMQAKEEGKYLPADKVATLGVLLNAPVDSKLEKSFIDEVQKAHMANAEPQQGPNEKPQAPQPGMLAQSADYATPMQTSMS